MIKFEKLPANILDKMEDLKQTLQQDPYLVFACLFGGLSTGRMTALTDIDIAVFARNPPNDAEYKLHLFDIISDTLGTSEVDLVILNRAPISVAGRIVLQKKILVDKIPFLRHLYESKTLREFYDFRIKEAAFFERRYGRGR